MAGSILSVALIGASGVLALGLAATAAGATAAQRAAGAADNAALAAADAASGAVPGEPCARAQQVARANAAEVTFCQVDGLVATIWVAVGQFSGVDVVARARAGPPNLAAHT